MLALALSTLAAAQVPDPGWRAEDRHLSLLAGWSAANLAGGTAGLLLAETPENRTFHATNIAWNTVNAGIAASGLLRLDQRRFAPSPEALRRRHRVLHTTLAVNLALDVAYVGIGAALWAARPALGEVQLRPVGQSLVLQGGFLFAFDAAFLLSHRGRSRGRSGAGTPHR